MSDSRQAHKQAQKKRRAKRIPLRRQALLDLAKDGFVVQELTPFCVRVNGLLDCFLTHNRWQNVKTGERGGCKDLAVFSREFFKGNVPVHTRWRISKTWKLL